MNSTDNWLKIGRLVSDKSVRRARVVLGKTVVRELQNEGKDLFGDIRRHTLRGGATEEGIFALNQEILLLLADGPAQDIRLAQSEARDRRGYLQDLLLVDEDSVCVLQYWLQRG
jgi:hypothetical protein